MLKRMDTSKIPAVPHPRGDCAWCWYTQHPTTPFPEQRSSSCCTEHQVWLLVQRESIRQKRAEARRASDPSEHQELRFRLPFQAGNENSDQAIRPRGVRVGSFARSKELQA